MKANKSGPFPNLKPSLCAAPHLFGGAACAGAALLLLATTINIQAQYKYTTLFVPGPVVSTVAAGISSNNIVGYYNNGSGYYSGFLYNGSNYTTLSVPGALSTMALGISGNDIVGSYVTIQGKYSVVYGFLYNGSTYTTLIEPGGGAGSSTHACGISGNDIVGFGVTEGGSIYGFLYNGSTYTALSPLGATFTYAYGISGNTIVGYYDDTNYIAHGFLYNGSNYTFLNVGLNVPGAVDTYAQGISGTNIVGYYSTSSGGTYGFIYNGSSYTTLSVPGATSTEALGISGNSIVGYYNNGSTDEGFLATPVVQPQPHITGIALSGPGLILSGTNGMAGEQYVLMSSTNVAAPLNQWLPILTNNFDSNGNFICTNPISANAPKNFYLLQVP
jgi:hypothetical protein